MKYLFYKKLGVDIMKVETFFDWGSYSECQDKINEFLQTVEVIDIKVAMSDNHEMMVVMYDEK